MLKPTTKFGGNVIDVPNQPQEGRPVLRGGGGVTPPVEDGPRLDFSVPTNSQYKLLLY